MIHIAKQFIHNAKPVISFGDFWVNTVIQAMVFSKSKVATAMPNVNTAIQYIVTAIQDVVTSMQDMPTAMPNMLTAIQ